MSQPRRHHYCPQFYLSNFTADIKSDSRLWTLDKSNRKVRLSTPNREAHQRDFYRLEIEGDRDPFVLEKTFSKIEGGAKAAIDHILATEQMPDIDGYGYLVSFIGLQAVRIPSRRNWLSDSMERMVKQTNRIVLATKEQWEVLKVRLKASGQDVPDSVTYEQMIDFLERDQF